MWKVAYMKELNSLHINPHTQIIQSAVIVWTEKKVETGKHSL